MRILVWLSIGLAGACAMGAYWIRGPMLLWLMIVGLGLLISCAMIHKYRRFPGEMLVFLAGFTAGCAMFFCYDASYLAPARAADGTTREICVTASDFSRETAYGCAVNGEMALQNRTYKITLYLDEYRALSPGDMVELSASLRFTDEGGNHEPTYHRSNGILLLAYQEDEAVFQSGEPQLKHQPAILRQRWVQILKESFPEKASGFARALFLGDKTELDEEIVLSFRLSGLSHIVAVSGLHVSVLFGLIYVLAGKRPVLTALLGIPVVLVFAAVTGFTPSVTRAAVMQSMMMLALVAKREYDPPTALAFAVTVMLIVNPLVIASAGFQMSVCSVAGIFLFYSDFRKRLGGTKRSKGKGLKNKILRGVGSSLALSMSASLPVIPLVAWYYGTVSLVSLIANLLVVPVISFVFYGVGLVCLTGLLIPAVAQWISGIVLIGIQYALVMAKMLASLPLAAVYTQSIYIVLWLVFCAALMLWGILCRPERISGGVCMGIIGLCCALLLSWAEPLTVDYQVTMLDVGQGQSVILQSRGNTFLVDCGGDSDTGAGDTAAEMLLSMGITRLDGLILTHYDRDHVGGVARLAQRIDIDRVYLPQTADTDGLLNTVLESTGKSEQILLTADAEITMGDCVIQIFIPESGKSGNESCAAVLFQSEKYDTLITGDRNSAGERALLDSGVLPDLEVLVVGHHGAADSASAELLYRTAPEIAMISVGRNNPYGHPRAETLERLRLYGCAVYRTDLMGNLVFRG